VTHDRDHRANDETSDASRGHPQRGAVPAFARGMNDPKYHGDESNRRQWNGKRPDLQLLELGEKPRRAGEGMFEERHGDGGASEKAGGHEQHDAGELTHRIL
jgi:hypothetical protein